MYMHLYSYMRVVTLKTNHQHLCQCITVKSLHDVKTKTKQKQKTWCLTSTETIRLIMDGEKGVWRLGGGGEGDYIPIATLSPPE